MLRPENGFGFFHVTGSVNTMALPYCNGTPDSESALKPPQLLEVLSQFQGRLREFCNLHQGTCAVTIKPDMPVIFMFQNPFIGVCVTVKRNYRPAEIDCIHVF